MNFNGMNTIVILIAGFCVFSLDAQSQFAQKQNAQSQSEQSQNAQSQNAQSQSAQGQGTQSQLEAMQLPIQPANGLGRADEDFSKYNDYYQIQNQDIDADVDLFNQVHKRGKIPLPSDAYNRQRHFGGWIRYRNDNTCLDTRGLVLQRDSTKPIQTNSSCRVVAGEWNDEYTGNEFSSAGDMQIDHVVPLKHAYRTGAFEWDSNKRCLYANYMGSRFHLLSVNGSENMRKGDRGPTQYIPPNQKFTCGYLKIWLQVKYFWNLRITPTEKTSIESIVQSQHCDVKQFKISSDEVREQRQYMKQNKNLCAGKALTAFY